MERGPHEGEAGPSSAEPDDSLLAHGVDRIAHQLKNPLQALTVNLEVVRLRAGGTGAAGEIERLTRVMDENVRLLDRRIRLLLALARRSDQEPLKELDLVSFVEDTVAAFRLDEREEGRGVELRIPRGEALPVRGRPGGLVALLIALSDVKGPDGAGPSYLRVGPTDEGVELAAGGRGEGTSEGRLRISGDSYRRLVAQARVAGARPASEGGLRYLFRRPGSPRDGERGSEARE